MTDFQVDDRVQRVETGELGTVTKVAEDPRQVHAPIWYEVVWDGSTVPESVVYPRQLVPAAAPYTGMEGACSTNVGP